jgi:Xaa-Pro aminopeptidase
MGTVQGTILRWQMLRRGDQRAGDLRKYAGAFAIFNALQEAMPGLTFVGETDTSALLQARATKDASEVERIRNMGKITVEVVDKVADFLTTHRVEGDTLVKTDGRPLTLAM